MKRRSALTLNILKITAIAALLAMQAQTVFLTNEARDSVAFIRMEVKFGAPFGTISQLANAAVENLGAVQERIFLGTVALAILAFSPWAKTRP